MLYFVVCNMYYFTVILRTSVKILQLFYSCTVLYKTYFSSVKTSRHDTKFSIPVAIAPFPYLYLVLQSHLVDLNDVYSTYYQEFYYSF